MKKTYAVMALVCLSVIASVVYALKVDSDNKLLEAQCKFVHDHRTPYGDLHYLVMQVSATTSVSELEVYGGRHGVGPANILGDELNRRITTGQYNPAADRLEACVNDYPY